VNLKRYYLGCLAHASYLIADEASGQAAVVDPQRDVNQYAEDARFVTAASTQSRSSTLSRSSGR
jgi:hydroxyacylglutathione hydrolase